MARVNECDAGIRIHGGGTAGGACRGGDSYSMGEPGPFTQCSARHLATIVGRAYALSRPVELRKG